MIPIIAVAVIVAVTGFVVWLYDFWRALAVVVTFGMIAAFVSVGYLNPRTVTCEVDGKDRVSGYKGRSDMRVYTADCGVLQVQDMFWAGEFNSADLFAAIEDGGRYRFEVTGVRVGYWSKFPNIRSVERVS